MELASLYIKESQESFIPKTVSFEQIESLRTYGWKRYGPISNKYFNLSYLFTDDKGERYRCIVQFLHDDLTKMYVTSRPVPYLIAKIKTRNENVSFVEKTYLGANLESYKDYEKQGVPAEILESVIYKLSVDIQKGV